MTYVTHKFHLNNDTCQELHNMDPQFGFNGFSEFIFYRTYSRSKSDGKQETWADCIIRVIEGVMSIRKNHYLRNHIEWNEGHWQQIAKQMAISAFKMHWLPPGRGLWAMGSDYVYERGAMALYSCAFTTVGTDFRTDCYWAMDALMNGVGVGFMPVREDDLVLYQPSESNKRIFEIPDTREGWCQSIQILIDSYCQPDKSEVHFDYTQIRPAGEPIRGFGGIASGPGPLQKLHANIRHYCEQYLAAQEHMEDAPKDYDSVRLKTDIVNSIGCCVVAGNVRRSAEIAVAPIDDPVFMDLKNYDKYPERGEIGWMSNNSVLLQKPEDFARLGDIAERVINNGEPGYLNLLNVRYGRLRVCKDDHELCPREDKAVGVNPCGEIPLEDKEVCNIAETFPTNCPTVDDWFEACEWACLYCSTVSLLPTHSEATNRVVARNRRIGVGIVDFTGWKHENGIHKLIRWMRDGYKRIRGMNKELAAEAGVPESIRVTTIKPGGTVPKLAGKTSGISYPTFHHTVRRVRVAKNAPVAKILIDARIPHENDVASDNTWVFEFPILQGPAKQAKDVTLWEQATNLALVQREWADNAVSNTLCFRPKWLLIRKWTHIPTHEELIGVLWKHGINRETLDASHKALASLVDRGYYEDTAIRLEREKQFGVVKIFRYNVKHEEDDIEPVLAFLAPVTKSVSLLPHTDEGVYEQMPESGCSAEEYEERLTNLQKIDWGAFHGSDGEDTRYCDGDQCELSLIAQASEVQD